MNHLKLMHLIIKDHIQEGHILVDATTGNGNDTLFMANLIKKHTSSKLYGYDIQEQAIQATRENLTPLLIKKVTLRQTCHTAIERDFEDNSVDLILFNLGYLPGQSKAITTMEHSTLKACQSTLNKLKLNGLLLVTVYPGHSQGLKESLNLKQWVLTLDSKKFYTCIVNNILNYKAPYNLIIQKRDTPLV